MNNLFILDTRNQKDSFVVKGLENLGFETTRQMLFFGDVVNAKNIYKAIDLKSSGGGLIELSRNICSKDHNRLKREIEKCAKFNGELIFLIFEPNISCIEDIKYWEVPKFKSDQWKTIYIHPETGERCNKLERQKKTNENVKWITKKVVSHKKGDLITNVKPETLMKAIKTMSEPNHYACKVSFRFTTKQNCGYDIYNLLL